MLKAKRETDKVSPHSDDEEELPAGWRFFFATSPQLWIPGLIAFVIIKLFGVPDELRLAVFLAVVVALLMIGSFLAVYLVAR